MSYSRRQLYALGEPLGECVTRKEGGRIIYGGGGSPSAPEKTTQVSDLPDWAKPSAQSLLGKAEALTDINRNPYQQYQGERVAQFTPLQQRAYEGASQLNAGPQGFAEQVPQYMSPYMQNVIDREKMEAARASQMLGAQQQAKATQVGAFGGYREGIERAERERGLRSQLGDIQTRGLQSAYDRAAEQFRSGITQNLAVGQQQAALGGQQQQQVQNILNTQYQDFLNQQRYPYQQLEFMSNVLRGTPMGTVQSMYTPAPSTLGQLAGLGLGAYGLFGRGAADGGLMKSYAEGGVTSDASVEDILSKLSDEQLQQAKQIAMAQRDMERVQMIDEELAERASIKGGLGGAFNMLPQEQQDAVTEMAGGGIVALSNGGLSDAERRRLEEQTRMYVLGAQEAARQRALASPASPVSTAVPVSTEGLGSPNTAAEALLSTDAGINPLDIGGRMRGGKSIAEYYNEPVSIAPTAGVPRMTAPQPAMQTYTRRGGAPAPSERPVAVAKAPAKTSGKGVQAAAQAVGAAAQQTTGVSRTSMEDAFKQGLALMRDEQGEADSKRMTDLINKISKSDAPDKMEMLANFGFKMAAAASKPGARFLGAAAEGAQVVPEMLAQARKDAKEAQKLGITLEMEKLKLDAANRKGDKTAALQHAQNIRILEGQEAQLAETIRANRERERLQSRQIDVSAQRAAASQGQMATTMARIRAANAQKAQAQASKDWKEDYAGKGVRAQYPSLQAYQKSIFENLQLQSLPQLELLGAVGSNTD